jgi:hypothetical protein
MMMPQQKLNLLQFAPPGEKAGMQFNNAVLIEKMLCRQRLGSLGHGFGLWSAHAVMRRARYLSVLSAGCAQEKRKLPI